jgi:hypothetical protein
MISCNFDVPVETDAMPFRENTRTTAIAMKKTTFF